MFNSNRLIEISRRTAEVIGVRSEGIAKVKVEYIGPAPTQGDGRVLAMMLSRAMVYVGVGLAAGLAGAYALSAFVASFLFRVEPGDPAVYIGTGVLLVAIGLLAAWIPSRRASRVDPIIALRT